MLRFRIREVLGSDPVSQTGFFDWDISLCPWIPVGTFTDNFKTKIDRFHPHPLQFTGNLILHNLLSWQGKDKVVTVFNYAPRQEDIWGYLSVY